MGKLMHVDQWRAMRFEGKAPSAGTVRRWCRNGELPAKKIGAHWFVDLDAEKLATGNALADDVLRAMG